jgi:hypothetical protein
LGYVGEREEREREGKGGRGREREGEGERGREREEEGGMESY